MNVKPILLSPLGLLPLTAGPAEAADLPVKARTPIADPYSPLWNGFYGGVHLGAINARSSLSPYRPSSAPGTTNYCWSSTCSFSSTQNALGVLAGFQLGYNFQFQRYVFGIETDFSYSGAKKNVVGTHAPGAGVENWVANTGVEAFGTTRLRFGYTFDRALVYATGGAAYASMRDQFQAYPDVYVSRAITSKTGWRWGWTAGVGVEYSVARNWSIKAEGLYYDMGAKSHMSFDNFGNRWGLYDRMTGVIGRLGVNYQFR